MLKRIDKYLFILFFIVFCSEMNAANQVGSVQVIFLVSVGFYIFIF